VDALYLFLIVAVYAVTRWLIQAIGRLGGAE